MLCVSASLFSSRCSGPMLDSGALKRKGFSKTWLGCMIAWGPPPRIITTPEQLLLELYSKLEWKRAAGVIFARLTSLKGFQLLHLRSKRRKRLLCSPHPPPSLTFTTLTSIDRGGGVVLESGGLSNSSKVLQLLFQSFLSFVRKTHLPAACYIS